MMAVCRFNYIARQIFYAYVDRFKDFDIQARSLSPASHACVPRPQIDVPSASHRRRASATPVK